MAVAGRYVTEIRKRSKKVYSGKSAKKLGSKAFTASLTPSYSKGDYKKIGSRRTNLA